jgi:hypothetical protein
VGRWPIHYEGDVIIPNVQEPDVPLTNTQWTTVMVGELYIHTASSSTAPDIVRDWNWNSAPRARSILVQIWPIKERIIKWPFRSLTDTDAWRFAVAHFTQLDSACFTATYQGFGKLFEAANRLSNHP